MSYKERMQTLASARDLHELMGELLLSGSARWTYDAAASHVPPHLWSELAFYFNNSGELRRPEREEIELPAERRETTGFDLHASFQRSLSVVVATFHDQLAGVRASYRECVPPAGLAVVEQRGVEGRATVADVATIEVGADDAPPRKDGFECIICTHWTPGQPSLYRNTEMCRECETKLRQ